VDEVAVRNERALLASVILDNTQFKKCNGISAVDFRIKEHRAIWASIEHLAGLDAPFDAVSINTRLHDEAGTDADRLNDADEAFRAFFQIVDGSSRSANAWWYANQVIEESRRRQAVTAALEFQAMVQRGATVEDLASVFHSYSERMTRILSAEAPIREIDIHAACNTPLTPIPWIAEGWLADDDRVIFGGEWGTGKSLIVDDLCISVASGIKWLDTIPILKTGPVLYVDEENPPRVVESRFYRMVRGRNLDPQVRQPIRYLNRNRIKLDQPKGIGLLRRVMDEHEPVLVVLDSMARFHTREENDNSAMSSFLDEFLMPLVVDYGCAFVILDHMRKPSRDDEKQEIAHRIRGAGSKMDVTDTGWVIYGDRDSTSRTLECRKSRSEESRPQPIKTTWVTEGDSAWIEAAPEKLGCETAIWSRLVRAGEDGALRKDVLTELQAQGFGKRGFEKALATLTEKGAVKRANETGKLIRLWLTANAPIEAA
jgi:hypothetical protein